MRIVFWNVQRLGGSSPDLKKLLIEGVLAELFKLDVTWALLCEVTSDTKLGQVPIQKQLALVKRSKKKSQSQLGYAWLKKDLSTGQLSRHPIDPLQILMPSGENVRISKGGSYFQKLSKRVVAYVGQDQPPVGPLVYLYHANASSKAAHLVTQAVATCVEDVDKTAALGFLLVGDLNCEPLSLSSYLEVNLKDRAGEVDVAHGGKTHNARTGLNTIYDYAVHSSNLMCEVAAFDIQHAMKNFGKKNLPDHLPILVGIGESLTGL
jgi:hypothetical protein